MKLCDCLSEESLKKVAQSSIEQGAVYRICMDIDNGIIPKHGDKSRNKYFVILGYDDQGNVYGGVIINSKINQNLPSEKKNLLMPILVRKYNFLEHDSFIDCCKIKQVEIIKFREWEYKGKIDDDDIGLIVGTLRESKYESKAKLYLFKL